MGREREREGGGPMKQRSFGLIFFFVFAVLWENWEMRMTLSLSLFFSFVFSFVWFISFFLAVSWIFIFIFFRGLYLWARTELRWWREYNGGHPIGGRVRLGNWANDNNSAAADFVFLFIIFLSFKSTYFKYSCNWPSSQREKPLSFLILAQESVSFSFFCLCWYSQSG